VLVMRVLGALEDSPTFQSAALAESRPGEGGVREFVLVASAVCGAEEEDR
jgi:hypothetical protein